MWSWQFLFRQHHELRKHSKRSSTIQTLSTLENLKNGFIPQPPFLLLRFAPILQLLSNHLSGNISDNVLEVGGFDEHGQPGDHGGHITNNWTVVFVINLQERPSFRSYRITISGSVPNWWEKLAGHHPVGGGTNVTRLQGSPNRMGVGICFPPPARDMVYKRKLN